MDGRVERDVIGHRAERCQERSTSTQSSLRPDSGDQQGGWFGASLNWMFRLIALDVVIDQRAAHRTIERGNAALRLVRVDMGSRSSRRDVDSVYLLEYRSTGVSNRRRHGRDQIASIADAIEILEDVVEVLLCGSEIVAEAS